MKDQDWLTRLLHSAFGLMHDMYMSVCVSRAKADSTTEICGTVLLA